MEADLCHQGAVQCDKGGYITDLVLQGTDTAQAGVIEPLDDLRVELIGTLDEAPWVATATRSSLLDSLAAVESEVSALASLEEVRASLDAAGAAVRAAFGAS